MIYYYDDYYTLSSVTNTKQSGPVVRCLVRKQTVPDLILLSSPFEVIRLMCSLVTSIFLYACESWTLTAELQRSIQTMEMRCCHKILHISHKDHVTNQEVRAEIQQAIGPHEDLLTTVNRCNLQWYGHVSWARRCV